jgi:glutamine cyclotransferase
MKPLLLVSALAFLVSCNNEDTPPTEGPRPDAPKSIGYSIINTYPHDTGSFTQGLIVYNGVMYEGTGDYGHSKLLKVDLNTGKAEQAISLENKYFGEGITILRDTIYQLTWKERKVFAYTLADFKKVREFTINTEGWGLTTDGTSLIVSDGSNQLYYYNPTTFQLIKTQSVMEAGSLAFNLNELEFIDGYIYANKFQGPEIYKIDPASGNIVGKIDVSDLWKKIQLKDPAADVPNGIAYDSSNGKIYITGKKWPELYEVQLSK